MQFEDFDGIGKITAEKLRKAGFTVENIQETSLEDLIDKTGIQDGLAKQILVLTSNVHEEVTEDTEQEQLPTLNEQEDVTDEDNSGNDEKPYEHDIYTAKEYRVKAFKESEDYDPDNEAEAYNEWYENILRKNNYLRR